MDWEWVVGWGWVVWATFRPTGAALALSVPIICHLGLKLPACTSTLLNRSFPSSSPVSSLTFNLKNYFDQWFVFLFFLLGFEDER